MKKLWTLAILLAAAAGHAEIPRSQVFPLDELPASLRPRAEQLLLTAMDREALFTVAGGLKPMSSGFASLSFPEDKPDLAEMENMRRILRAFRAGSVISASLQPFVRASQGRRFLDGVIFHRPAMAESISAHQDVFSALGITPSSEPIEALLAVDADATTRRNRGLGIFFGYPDYAVDFFVEAAESQRKDGKFVERDFIQIPTFESASGRFVYAVPKGHRERAEDRALRLRAAPILAKYRALRQQYVGPGKPGIVELIRDWMDDGSGRCSPETARRKAEQSWAAAPAGSR